MAAALTPPDNSPHFRKVALCSGHMIDAPSRPTPRFPPYKEAVVQQQIIHTLKVWQIGATDLAICGGAQGADILFAEAAVQQGAMVYLLLPLPEPEFLQRSVHLEGGNWEARFWALLQHSKVFIFFLADFLKKHPEANLDCNNIFAKNNLWMIHTAISAQPTEGLSAILVWDKQPTGDSPGGTADFAARIRAVDGVVTVIDPTQLT